MPGLTPEQIALRRTGVSATDLRVIVAHYRGLEGKRVPYPLFAGDNALALYAEKRNGDYFKRKVRLRWYDDPRAVKGDTPMAAFFEIKRKYGALRRKERIEIAQKALTKELNDFLKRP